MFCHHFVWCWATSFSHDVIRTVVTSPLVAVETPSLCLAEAQPGPNDDDDNNNDFDDFNDLLWDLLSSFPLFLSLYLIGHNDLAASWWSVIGCFKLLGRTSLLKSHVGLKIFFLAVSFSQSLPLGQQIILVWHQFLHLHLHLHYHLNHHFKLSSS